MADAEGSKRYFTQQIISIVQSKLVMAWVALALMCCASAAIAETCTTASDMEPATRSALVSAGQHFFDLLAKGDAASLRQAAIPSLASDFSAIEATIKDNQAALAGSKATARPPFLLEAEGVAPIARAEFYCG
ncbi:MAG: hypothetical protein WBP97_02495, partial [Candidatus Sulfotelmatobacter sp.]